MQRQRVDRLVQMLFLGVFGAVLAMILFCNRVFHYNRLLQLLGLAVLAVCVWGALWLVDAKGLAPALLARRRQLLLCALVLQFLLQSVFSVLTVQTVDHDIGKVFNGAYLYLADQGHPDYYQYVNYLNHWTNNTGIFVVLVGLGRSLQALGLFSYRAFYALAVVTGQFCFVLAMLFTFLYLERFVDPLAAVYSLPLWLLFPVVWLQGGVFYTDTYSIAFAPLLLYLLSCAGARQSFVQKLPYLLAGGAALALGLQIKATVLFVVLAWLLLQLGRGHFKNALCALLVLALTVAPLQLAAKRLQYTMVLEPQKVEQMDTPTAFWLMMGLSDQTGEFNYLDEDAIRGIPTQKEKTAYCLQTALDRLRQRGFGGTANFLLTKLSRTFGSGNADIGYMLSRGPLHPRRAVYQFILPQGRFYGLFNNANQAVYTLLYLLALAGAALGLRRLARAEDRLSPPPAADVTAAGPPHEALSEVYLALCGFVAFMLLWESNHRQLVNQWPLLIAAAAVGLARLQGLVRAWWQRHRRRSAP